MTTTTAKPRYTVKVPNTCFGAPRGWLVTGKTSNLEEAQRWAANFAATHPVETYLPKYRAARIIDNAQ